MLILHDYLCSRNHSYAVGVARSKTITGPYEKHVLNPILHSNSNAGDANEGFDGTGHCSVLPDPVDPQQWIIFYHAYTKPKTSGARSLLMDVLTFDTTTSEGEGTGEVGWPRISTNTSSPSVGPRPLPPTTRASSTSRTTAPPPSCSNIPTSAPWIDCALSGTPHYGPLPPTAVSFNTSHVATQTLFDHAETCEAANTLSMAPGFEVLVEGGHYNAVWLETQPMGGATYGVRNLRLALNNQLIFMRTQREDGRLAGMVNLNKSLPTGTGVVHPTFSYPGNANHSMLQGFYMASPAVDVAWLMNQSATAEGGNGIAMVVSAYLAELKLVLEKFDAWLWSARNSTHGVLWLPGTADTGEDGSDKFAGFTPPFESMDMMGYSHDAQRALARIARIEGDAAAVRKWEARMASTASALKRRLWREPLGACFDRERDGATEYVTTLVHNNIRAMWHGIFSQSMADRFIASHLMNMSEFWTATPLPSIAVSDARFANKKGNNWSGPPEGLTFQRTIRALMHYGHHAEIVLIGVRLRKALLATNKFPQQIDPFTSMPDQGDCYGPMLLSFLQYTALTTGIAVRPETGSILWSSIATTVWKKKKKKKKKTDSLLFTFTQTLGTNVFTIAAFEKNASFVGRRNGVLLFECSGNTRLITGVNGVVTGVVGASSKTESVVLRVPGQSALTTLIVAPNEEWTIANDGRPSRTRKVPFTMPFS